MLLLMRFVFSLSPRVVTVGGYSSYKRIRFILKFISLFKGLYYVIQTYNAPTPIEFIHNYYLRGMKDPYLRKVLNKTPGSFKEDNKKTIFGTALLQSRFEDDRLSFFTYANSRAYLGFYKLYSCWDDAIKKRIHFENDRLNIEKYFIVIVAYKPEEYFLDSKDDYLVLLEETIKCIREFYPNTLVVIKPKSFKKDEVYNAWLYDFIISMNDDNLVSDHSPLPFLAKKTIFAVFNIISTSFFDFTINNVPCIENSRYGKNFYFVNPNGSYMQRFGVAKRSETIHEFKRLISMVQEGKFPLITMKEIKHKVNHKYNKKVFMEL